MHHCSAPCARISLAPSAQSEWIRSPGRHVRLAGLRDAFLVSCKWAEAWLHGRMSTCGACGWAGPWGTMLSSRSLALPMGSASGCVLVVCKSTDIECCMADHGCMCPGWTRAPSVWRCPGGDFADLPWRPQIFHAHKRPYFVMYG